MPQNLEVKSVVFHKSGSGSIFMSNKEAYTVAHEELDAEIKESYNALGFELTQIMLLENLKKKHLVHMHLPLHLLTK